MVVSLYITGTITRVHVRPGSLAVAKAPLLELADLSSLVVRFAVPEIHAAAVQLDMGLEFLPDAHPGKVFQGHVVRIYPDLDQRMRTRTVEAGIAAGAELIPGMFGRLKLSLRIAEETVVLPSGAVTATPQGMAAVFVVEEGKARRQIVTTGIEADNRVQILSGVQPGDTIVVAGHEKLKDGASVRVEGEDRQDQGKNTKSTGQSTAMEPKAGGGDQ